MPYSQKTGFDTLRVACNRLQPTCMKQNMTASGARCWVISAMPPSPASRTVSFLTPSGPYPKITLHQNKASCLVCPDLAVPSECPCGHQISITALSCTLPSAATPISRVQRRRVPEGGRARLGNAPGHLTLGIAHVGNDLPDIPFVLPSHFASHCVLCVRRRRRSKDAAVRSRAAASGERTTPAVSVANRTEQEPVPRRGERRPRRTNATKIKDDVDAAAEQGRGGGDPCDPDSRARDLTRAMNTGPLARSSLLFPASSVHRRPGMPGHAGGRSF
jgi:hypothetical protein